MTLKFKKNLAITIVMFFFTTIFSNFMPSVAYADTLAGGNAFSSQISIMRNGKAVPIDKNASLNLNNGDKVQFRIDFNCKSNVKAGDKLVFNLPEPFTNVQPLHFPSGGFNAPIVSGNTVTLVANKGIDHAIGGYLTVEGTFKTDGTSGTINVPIDVNGNGSHITIHYKNPETDGGNHDKPQPEKPVLPVLPVNKGGSIIKTVDGKNTVVVDKLTTKNNVFHYKVIANTEKMTVPGIFEDGMYNGLVLLPNTFKIVDQNGRDLTQTLKDKTKLVGIEKGSCIKITGLPQGNIYTITYDVKIPESYFNVYQHNFYNTATIGGASSTATITANIGGATLSPDKVKTLAQKTVVNGNNYSNIGQTKQYQIVTNYNNYELPVGTKVVDKLPAGLEFPINPKDAFITAYSSGPYNKVPSYPANVYVITKDGKKLEINPSNNSCADIVINYQTQTLTLTITKQNNNSFIIKYNTVINKLEPSITNNAIVTVGKETGESTSKVEFSSDAGLLKAWKSVNIPVVYQGDKKNLDEKVVYTINVNSEGSFPVGYLNITDNLQAGIKFNKIILPKGFTYTKDGQKISIKNTEPLLGTHKDPLIVKINLECNLKDAPAGTTISNTAYVNDHQTNTVTTKKGFAFTAIKEGHETNKPLKGAVYGVYDSDNTCISQVTSDQNGVMGGPIPSAGRYYLKELQAPIGYQLSPEKVGFEITKDDVGTTVKIPTIYDKKIPKKGNIEITKEAFGTNKVLEGAVFNLEQKGKVIQSGQTDKNGKLTFSNIPQGEYQIVEVSAPKGYEKAAITNVIVDGGKTTQQKIIDKEIKGKLKITKIDSITNTPLTGAVFEVTGPNGYKNQAVVKDTNGVVSLDNLEWGEYTVKEIVAPIGYNLDTTPQRVTINQDSFSSNGEFNEPSFIFKDSHILGKLQIVKTNAKGEKLSGAAFEVTGPNGYHKYPLVTDENGVVSLNNLEWGTYHIKEIKAPEGYDIQNNIKDIVIGPDNAKTIQISNVVDGAKSGRILITKTGEDGSKLVGATFTVKDKSGNVIATQTTAKNGVAEIIGLPWGEYTVQETVAPKGYKLSDKITKITVNAQNVSKEQNITINDTRVLGSIQVTKLGKDKVKLKEAEFTVTGPNKFSEIITTNKDGVATLSNLAWGTYMVQETKAPVGYELNTEVHIVKINADNVATATTGKIESKVQNVTIQDNQILGKIQVVKTNQDGSKKLEGAEFIVTGPNGVNQTIATNKDGIASLDNLAWGTYTIKETKAPVGYNLNQTPQTVDITNNTVGQVQGLTFKDVKTTGTLEISKIDVTNEKEVAGAKINITGTSLTGEKININFTSGTTPTKFTLPAGTYTYKEVSAPVGYEINTTIGTFIISKQGQIVKAVVKDSRILGEMQIVKINQDGTKKLNGAEFKITGPNGFNKTVITNKDGLSNLKDLAWGTYKVQETKAPIGYNLNEIPQTVEITNKSVGQVQMSTFKDVKTTGTVEISKVDATNEKEVAGAKINITGTSLTGEKININFTSGTTPTKFTLPAGIYKYTEVDAPVGYNINTTVGTFTISKQGQVVKAVVKDTPITGVVRISKVDITNEKEVAGAKINITGTSLTGNKINITFVSGTTPKEFTLPAGTYKYTEVDAPVGYEINTTIGTFTISKQGQIVKAVVKDNRISGKIQITKTNETGNMKLEGATFQILGPNGFSKDVTTDSNGSVDISNLQWGNYIIKEIKAPKGYTVNPEIFNIAINANNVAIVQSINIKDKLIPVQKINNNKINNNNNNKVMSPKTGDSSQVPLMILGAIALIILIIVNRKKLSRSRF